uniref:Uncharacterized protein n=1 Tax=Seriola dumerili TaxID=41447 RepID=A0A3B4VCS0_SERDU
MFLFCRNSHKFLIHVELLRVHRAQLGVSVLDVVQVLHGIFQPTHHGLTVLGHLGVSEDGGIGGHVAKCGEVSLSPWIHNQKSPGQSLGSNFTHINLSPQGNDGGALSICPIDHGDGMKVSSDKTSFLITSLLI